MVDIAALTAKKRKDTIDQMDLCNEAIKIIGGGDIDVHESRLLEIAQLLTTPNALEIVSRHVDSLRAVANFFGAIAAGHELALDTKARPKALPPT